MYAFFVPSFYVTDEHGYHLAAVRLQESGSVSVRPEDPYAFVGSMWVRDVGGGLLFYPKYPPLYPALIAAANAAFGRGAGMYVNPALAALCLVGVFLVWRIAGHAGLGVFTAAILATNPVFNRFALNQTSHASNVTVLVWGTAAFLWARNQTAAARRNGGFALAGLLVGSATGVRYTSALLVLPGLAASLLGPPDRRLRDTVAFCGGLALPFGGLAIYHWLVYGNPLQTGYGLTGEQEAFTLHWFLRDALRHGAAFFHTGLGPAAVAALAGLGLLWVRDTRTAAIATLAIVPLSLLSASYFYSPDDSPVMWMRLYLPVLVVGMFLAAYLVDAGASRLSDRPVLRATLVLGLLAIQTAWGIARTLDVIELQRERQLRTRRAASVANRQVPAGADLYVPRRLAHLLDVYGRHRVYDAELLEPVDEDEAVGQRRQRQRRLRAARQEAFGLFLARRLGETEVWALAYGEEPELGVPAAPETVWRSDEFVVVRLRQRAPR